MDATPSSSSDEPDSHALPDLASLSIAAVPEIVLGLARPIGTDTHAIRVSLEEELRRTGFITEQISVAGLIHELHQRLEHEIASETASARYDRLMRFGDYLRYARGSQAAADLVIAEIARRRPDAQARARQFGANGVAYLVRNLMHPSEVSQLRNIYKRRFFLLGVFGDAKDRRDQLVRELAEGGDSEAEAEGNAERFAEIDAGVRPSSIHLSRGALSVDRTFHMADVFLSLSSAGGSERAEETLRRFVDQLYSNPFGTPNPEEMGMACAFLAARRSGALARPVGAALTDASGCLLALGWNDPAAPGGGLYSESIENDPDPSDAQRLDAIQYFLDIIMAEETWSNEQTMAGLPTKEREWWQAFRAATQRLAPIERSHVTSLVSVPAVAAARVVNLIEFGRCVHAEMAAITDAARRGVAVQNATLYVTTFPCHECTRNIVAAGIGRVVYVEPYGKSLAPKLYSRRSVDFHTGPPSRRLPDDRVHFMPYVGISPSCFDVLFDWVPRKYDLGQLLRYPEHIPGAKVMWNRGDEGRLRTKVLGYELDSAADPDAKVDPLFEAAYALAELGVIRRVDRENTKAAQ